MIQATKKGATALVLGLATSGLMVSTQLVAKEPQKATSKAAVADTVVQARADNGQQPNNSKAVKTGYAPQSPATSFLQSGVASYYGPGFHGRLTANGERFNQNAMTAAHRKLPFGTKVKVTNLSNGRSTIVRINDRGPYVGNRVIDLSVAAAQAIGSTHSGTARVSLEVLR